MAEDAIPSDADPLRPRTSPPRLPSLAQLYAAQRLGYPIQAKSYTLPELYALEQTGAPLDLQGASLPQSNAPPVPPLPALPILADQQGAPLQPEPLTPNERLAGTVRAGAQGATGDLSDYSEALARTLLGWRPKSTDAQRAADAAFDKVGKVVSHEDATFRDHLTDIKGASKRFSDAYPVEASALRLSGTAAPMLAGVGTTGLLARILSGETLSGELMAARSVPPAGRLDPELAQRAASPAAASATSNTEPTAAHALAKAEPTAAARTAPVAEALPEAIARPPAKPDGRYYSVAHEVELQPKPKGTGRPGHNREANENLLREMEQYPDFAQMMENGGVYLRRTPTGLAPDTPPPGWTWHHVTGREGILHLMPSSQHKAREFQKVLHPLAHGGGGYILWGDRFVQIPGAVTGAIWSTHPREPAKGTQQDDDN